MDVLARLEELRGTVEREGTTSGVLGSLAEAVLTHYREHGRALPWRETTDPYAVVVSEVMLQQTQVGRVVPKFEAFMARFPTVEALAAAPLDEVLGVWQGLGYNRRAVALHRLARAVVEEHGGAIPRDENALVALPGIGTATARSILAYAFDEPTVFLETNVRTVLIHVCFPNGGTVDDAKLLPLAEALVPARGASEWYNALMDVGTLVKATTRNPSARSKQYRKQSRFEGSTRQLRGAVLRLLLGEGAPMPLEAMTRALETSPSRLEPILRALEGEGFIAREGEAYRLETR